MIGSWLWTRITIQHSLGMEWFGAFYHSLNAGFELYVGMIAYKIDRGYPSYIPGGVVLSILSSKYSCFVLFFHAEVTAAVACVPKGLFGISEMPCAGFYRLDWPHRTGALMSLFRVQRCHGKIYR